MTRLHSAAVALCAFWLLAPVASADPIVLQPGGSIQIGNNVVTCSAGAPAGDVLLDQYCYCTGDQNGCEQRDIVKRYIFSSGRTQDVTISSLGTSTCVSLEDCQAAIRDTRVCRQH